MIPRIILSKTLVDFGNKVVIRSNQMKAPYIMDVYVTNQGGCQLAGTDEATTTTTHCFIIQSH